MLDHVTIGVSDIERSKAFYDSALRPLGIERLYADGPTFAGYDRETVQQFHRAALAAGGQDNGPPGLRPHYHENYYGAFILDPDGHNIEAVCHSKQT